MRLWRQRSERGWPARQARWGGDHGSAVNPSLRGPGGHQTRRTRGRAGAGGRARRRRQVWMGDACRTVCGGVRKRRGSSDRRDDASGGRRQNGDDRRLAEEGTRGVAAGTRVWARRQRDQASSSGVQRALRWTVGRRRQAGRAPRQVHPAGQRQWGACAERGRGAFDGGRRWCRLDARPCPSKGWCRRQRGRDKPACTMHQRQAAVPGCPRSAPPIAGDCISDFSCRS